MPFPRFGLCDATPPTPQILIDDTVVLNHEPAPRNSHPTALILMVVDRAHLSNIPANSDQLVMGSSIDQITSVVFSVPEQIGCKGCGVNWAFDQQSQDSAIV